MHSNKEGLSIECDKNLLQFTNQLEVLRNYQVNYDRNKFTKEENTYIEKHIHLHILVTISYLDTLTIVKHLNESIMKWEFLYFLKSMYLNIYETFKAYDSHPNSITNYFKNDKEVINQFAQIDKKLKFFRKNYKLQGSIKNIRHSVAGHIDKDFNKYFGIVNNITTEKTIKTGMEFTEILNELMKFLTATTSKIREQRYNG